MNFHNPYHFVPTSEKSGPDSISIEGFKTASHLTHARYVPDTGNQGKNQQVYSGRLVCRLVTESPLVIGASQTKKNGDPDEVSVVAPFMAGAQPAIPGSSLRGLISSIAEAASNSALRVLYNQSGYSFRRGMTEGLSAMGMVVVREDGSYWLKPLAIPHLRPPGADGFHLDDALPEVKRDGQRMANKEFTRDMFPKPNLKVYLGREWSICTRAFLDDHPSYHQAGDPERLPFFGLRLKRGPMMPEWNEQGLLGADFDCQHTRNGILLSQKPATEDSESEELVRWPRKADKEEATKLTRQGYTRGIFRTLGVTDVRKKHLPTKKHEYFIPYTAEMEGDFESTPKPGHWRMFPILAEAAQRFHALADERADAENTEKTKPDEALPYHPIGTPRGEDARSKPPQPPHTFRLKTGDIVFFRPTKDGQAIAEVSLSSIWRGQVVTLHGDGQAPAALPADFFAAINPDLLPLGAEANGAEANPELRKRNLTIAELLFGFVEQRQGKKADPLKEAALAFAGRLRPSAFALPEPLTQGADWWYCENSPEAPPLDAKGEQWFTLKILASPKPPSPAMYFRPKQGAGYIAKKNLAPGLHHPQGRKFYLHHGEDPGDWQSHPDNREDPKLKKQKMSVRPLQTGLTFWFHFDFDNLSETELQLLCYALRPTDQFRHKLGLGKSLGLGSVRLEPAGLFLVDRLQRYSTDSLTKPRYHHIWTDASVTKWVPQYQREQDESHDPTVKGEAPEFFKDLRTACRTAMHELFPETIETLEQIGDPALVSHQVHYPQIEGLDGAELEQEIYRWFMANDAPEGKNQTLHGTMPPILDRIATRCFFFIHAKASKCSELKQILSRHLPGRFKIVSQALPDAQSIVSEIRQEVAAHAVSVLHGFGNKPPPEFPGDLKRKVRFINPEKDPVKQVINLLRLPGAE